MHIKTKTLILWEYKVDNNVNIANFVCCKKLDYMAACEHSIFKPGRLYVATVNTITPKKNRRDFNFNIDQHLGHRARRQTIMIQVPCSILTEDNFVIIYYPLCKPLMPMLPTLFTSKSCSGIEVHIPFSSFIKPIHILLCAAM